MIASTLLLATATQAQAIPDAATLAAEVCDNKPVIMAVTGPTHDRARMAAYAEAIAASGLYQRLGGYYLNEFYPFEHLDGDAPDGFATVLVRFPCMANARKFWYSDAYQNEIKPIRLNPSAGDYIVRVYPERAVRADMLGKVAGNEYLAEFAGDRPPDPVRFADPAGLVLGISSTAEGEDYEDGWARRTLLRSAPDGSYAARITLSGTGTRRFGALPQSSQLYVLNGELAVAGKRLGKGDFVHLPQGSEMGAVSGTAGTSYLVYGDAPSENPPADAAAIVTRDAEVEWVPGKVAREAGADTPLFIKTLWQDEATGARTFLVRSAGGVAVPWELHLVSEEGFLVEGDYTLAECLPSGRRDFAYAPGGYFYRPAGILHSGPDSTSTAGATWLLRVPATLTATFYPSCPSAPIPEETLR